MVVLVGNKADLSDKRYVRPQAKASLTEYVC